MQIDYDEWLTASYIALWLTWHKAGMWALLQLSKKDVPWSYSLTSCYNQEAGQFFFFFWQHKEKNQSLAQGEGGRQWSLCSNLLWTGCTSPVQEDTQSSGANWGSAHRIKGMLYFVWSYLCQGPREEQSYSNQNQFTLNEIFTREKGLQLCALIRYF